MAAVDSSSSSTTLLLRMPYTYMLHLAGLIAAMWSCPGTAAFGVLASRMPIQQQQPRNPLMSPLLPGRQFSSSSSLLSSSSYAAAAGCCRRRHHHHHPRYAKNDSGEDEENDCSSQQQPGMDEAFRLLDSMLRSMDDDEPPPLPATASSETDKQQRPLNAAVNKIDVTALDRSALVLESSSVVQSVSPEKEIAVYKLMMEELEQNVDAEAYAEVLDDLGSTVMKDDVYSQVLTDLLGATSKRPTPATPAPIAAATTTVSDPPSILSGTTSSSSPSTEQFMQVALQEALQQVRVNNPRMNDSILDDKEIMKEIEGIFEQGNEKLMASLEEIRQEQQALAAASAAKNAQAAVENLNDDAYRLQNAEKSMQVMLKRVESETAVVERAVADLQKVNADLDKDFVVRLKRGGLVKQAALAGLILFAVRSIVDSVAAVGGDGDASAHLTAALVQAAVAVACAAIFFVV